MTTLLTTNEVAIILRVNPSTITRWAKDGKIPRIPILGNESAAN